MTSYRLQRVNDEIKRLIAEIFIKDLPRQTDESMITVTKVVCTSDLREARVYLSVYSDDQGVIEKTLKQVRGEASLIRGLLGQRLVLRYVPKLFFFYDDAQRYAEKIERLFQQIHHSEPTVIENPDGEDR